MQSIAKELKAVSAPKSTGVGRKPCSCGNPRRPKKNDCRACHSRKEAARARLKRQNALRKLDAMERLMINNPVTKARFVQRFGTDPHVLVLASKHHRHGEFRAFIIGFRPGDIVAVQGELQPDIVGDFHFDQILPDDRDPSYRKEAYIIPGRVTNPFLRKALFLPPLQQRAKTAPRYDTER